MLYIRDESCPCSRPGHELGYTIPMLIITAVLLLLAAGASLVLTGAAQSSLQGLESSARISLGQSSTSTTEPGNEASSDEAVPAPTDPAPASTEASADSNVDASADTTAATSEASSKPIITLHDSPSATEGQPLRFPVKLSHPAAQDVTVGYSTQSNPACHTLWNPYRYLNGAKAGHDYTPVVNEPVTIKAGQTQAAIEVPTLQDNLDENDEPLSLSLSLISGSAQLGQAKASGIIQDDNDQPPAVQFAAATSTATEGQTLTPPDITLSKPAGHCLVLATWRFTHLQTGPHAPSNSFAAVSHDWKKHSTTRTDAHFPLGATTMPVTVPVICHDGFVEQPETFAIDLYDKSGEIFGKPNSTISYGTASQRHTVTIQDATNPAIPRIHFDGSGSVHATEGEPLRFVLKASQAPARDMPVLLESPNLRDRRGAEQDDLVGFTRKTWFTFPAGATQATFELPTKADSQSEAAEAFTLRIHEDNGWWDDVSNCAKRPAAYNADISSYSKVNVTAWIHDPS